jgi:hypothetical protein
MCALAGAAVHAQEGALPPRSEWRATTSSTELPNLAPRFAIDGDPTTKWGGPFSAGHWLQIDMGRPAQIAGVVMQWDLAFAVAYFIQTSMDGNAWTTVYESADSAGTTDFVFFTPTQARYVRVASVPRSSDWGVNIFELEIIAASEAPRFTGIAEPSDSASIWSGGSARALTQDGRERGTRELRIALPRGESLAGVQVYWGAARAGASLEGREANGQWQVVASDPSPEGDTSFLSARTARRVNELRLIVNETRGVVPAIRRLRLLGPARVITPMKRYEIAASRAHRDLFPDSLHGNQVYWTAIGVPAGRQKSIFDEYGHIEAFKSAPLVQALWRDDAGRATASASVPRQHSLRAGWMPMPAVEWSAQPGLTIRSEAFTIEHAGQPVSLVRHRASNTGATRIAGQIAILVRPMQLNPPWQNGGPSPIRTIAIEGTNAQTSVRVNDRTLLHSLSPVDARGAAPFGEHGETEITRQAAAGMVPAQLVASDPDGLAAAILSYRVQLEPGASRDVVLALPLGTMLLNATLGAEPPAIDREALLRDVDAGAAFERLAGQVAAQWQARFGGIGLSLPDRSLVDMLRAQAAYMLINQTGHAMQPGPRNYNRSFIRDGSATAIALLRMGQAAVARDYLKWYAEHAVQANGLVSPILNDDGSVYRGFGSDIEYDAQGQFIYLVAEIARLDGGAATVRQYEREVKLAMKFMQELRERTLVPGYMGDRPAPERFRGIIAPSISHEGYATPTHSYWDDYWALKGWHDGAWLAESWGDRATATWAREQYAALHESMAASIRTTTAWRGADFVPTDADTGNPDPTSVSIALDPTGQQDLLPREALERTFASYLEDVRKRDLPDAIYGYTPYELRNTLTFVYLNQPQHAEEMLRSFLRHRRPLEWQVFAEVVQSRLRFAIYLGDMPHTWIGSEYVRAIFGMLMREGDDRLVLLPGAPVSWTRDTGIGLTDLPTAFGKLTMTAREQNDALRITLHPGLGASTKLRVVWPNRQAPRSVVVDGRRSTRFDAQGIDLDRPFKELLAQW